MFKYLSQLNQNIKDDSESEESVDIHEKMKNEENQERLRNITSILLKSVRQKK